MTTALEDRLREHYDERVADLPDRGPGLGEMSATSMYVAATGSASSRDRRRALIATLTISSAAAAIVGGFVLAGNRDASPIVPESAPPSAVPTASPPVEPAALEPVSTLPLTSDVSATPPPTVLSTGPVDWYRLAPDLDVAWYQNGTEPSMLCLRTPTEQTCRIDEFSPDQPLSATTSGGQLLVVVIGDQSESMANVGLSDGSIVSAPITWDPQIGWGVVRIAAGDGVTATAVSLGDVTLSAADDLGFDGATLGPAADLSASPVTVPAGQGLSYWRWLPDLDISEVQPAEGPTQLCYRTPAGEGCIDEDFNSPMVGLVPVPGGFIALVQPELIAISPPLDDPLAPQFEAGPPPTRVIAEFSDRPSVTADVHYGEQFGLGWARLEIPDGVTPAAVRSE